MPYSAPEGKDVSLGFIKRHVLPFKHNRFMDIGAGSGTYHKLWAPVFPEVKWTGIEVFEPYGLDFHLNSRYHCMIWADATKWNYRIWREFNYDLIILGDVIEHMPQSAIQKMWPELLQISRYVLVSTICSPYNQQPEEYERNRYEQHLYLELPPERLRRMLGNPVEQWVGQRIGVYLYKGIPD